MIRNLRRFSGIIAGIYMLAAMTGCGNNAKVIEGEVKDKDVEIGNDETDNEEEKAEELVTDEKTTEEETAYKGYAFIYQGIVIEIDAEADPILAQLGEANSYFEAASCAFNGLDKMYTYSSFELDTYPVEDKDFISMILFKDDSIATAEGISIGDPVDKIIEIYGEDAREENGMMVYVKDNMKLCFIIEEENVISIEYQTMVLDE